MNYTSLKGAVDLASNYTLSSGIITDPGQFEGESWQILYWYDSFLNGFVDDSGDEWDALSISPEERLIFNLDPAAEYAILFHSDTGFVGLEYATTAEYNDMLAVDLAQEDTIDE